VRELIGLVTLADILAAFGVERQDRGHADKAVRRDASPVRGQLVATPIIVVAVMGSLAAAVTWLARAERSETRADAARLFDEGRRAEARGEHDEALERFRSARSLVRDEPRYTIALAGALLGAERPRDASDLLAEVLQRAPTNGEANLIMARAQVHLQALADAASYYRRAIFGRWATNEAAQQVALRLELIELLSSEGRQNEVLAELLPLQERMPDGAIGRRVATLYTAAGAPDRALAIWRRLSREHPDDAEVLKGMGDAELARRRLGPARSRFRAALHLAPGDAEVRDRLALIEGVLALDPTQRGLSGTERYARSARLVQLVTASIGACRAGSALAPVARQTDTPPRNADERHAAIEANLDEAARLWALRADRCAGARTPMDEQLALVLSRTAS
jgi:tetratricopeptide (TPR) repeat protein